MDIADRVSLTGSLPTPLTSLIGRERELSEATALVCDPDIRLVTLTGPGGVGKTRLAIKVARQAIDAFPDGARFVDLTTIHDPALVAPAIAQAFGVHGGSDSVQLVLSVIAQRHLLLLIDNFEHVVEAAPAIAQLLTGAPDLNILVTSREPLKVSGEQEYPISPLTLPLPNHQSPQDLVRLDAVQLFAERARAVLPTFAVAPDNAAQVAEICRRLDGLPLAIELAAARVKTLPPTALLTRLEHRLPLLTGARRDAPQRQQTMRDAIAWSYALLPPNEQTLFRRLGVFVGGFTLDAAEIVAGTGIDVLAALSSLVDKSLVRQQTDSSTEPRYLMLETIREFALEHLAASDEHSAVRTAHAAWCTALGEAWRTYGDTKHQPEMAGVAEPPLEAEFDNVRAAMTWLDQSGNVPALARLAGAVWFYWVLHGRRTEGVHWLERARSFDTSAAVDKFARLWVMQGICQLCAQSPGRLEAATSAAKECLALARDLSDTMSEATASGMLGMLALETGDYERAEACIHTAIQLNEQIGHRRAVASDQILLVQIAFERREFEQAIEILQGSLEIHRQANDLVDQYWELCWLGLIRCERGEVRAAATAFQEALRHWHSIMSFEELSDLLAHLSVLAANSGESTLGANLLGAAKTLSDGLGYQAVYAERMAHQRAVEMLRDALGPEAFTSAWQSGAAMPVGQAITAASEFLDRLLAPAIVLERDSAPHGLTARELDVLHLLAQGKSDREIAEHLFIGTRTVETHVSNLLGKLGAHNRAEATALATREGLTEH